MDTTGGTPVLGFGDLHGQSLALPYFSSLRDNFGGEQTEINRRPQAAEAAATENVNSGHSKPSSLIGGMPPVPSIRYYSSDSTPLPSFKDFDHIKWVEWLRQLANPSPVEEALLWFLDPDCTIGGTPIITSYTPHSAHSTGIGKLPNEVLVMILDYSIDLKVSRLVLQLVNKHWYASMQAPNLWNNMTLELAIDGKYMYASNRLTYIRRCLQRAGSVTLDVTILIDKLDVTWDDGSHVVQIPSELILRRCGTKNWGSLVVVLKSLCSNVIVPVGFLHFKLDHIRFSSLKSLTVVANKFGVFKFRGEDETNSAAPTLLHKVGLLERIFDGSHFAQLTSLRTFEACAEAISTLPPCWDLQELHLSMKLSDYLKLSYPMRFPPTVFFPTISTLALRLLQLERVRHLTIEALTPDLLLHEVSIPFPELQVLIIEKSDFRSLIYISAPNLQELYIGSEYTCGKSHSADAADMITLFRHLPQYIKVAPKILQSRLPMTTEATMLLLEMWPQLEQASIRLVDTFEWQWLVEGLIKRKRVKGAVLKTPWKYCPHLRWLKLVIDGPVERRGEWGNHARSILRGRADSLLACVSWTCGNSPDIILNREDLDAEFG